MAILQGAQITGSIIATTFIKANGFSGSITASNLYVLGKAGIGTTTPATKFEMVGGEMAIKLGANTTSSFQWKNSSGTKIQEIRYDILDGSQER